MPARLLGVDLWRSSAPGAVRRKRGAEARLQSAAWCGLLQCAARAVRGSGAGAQRLSDRPQARWSFPGTIDQYFKYILEQTTAKCRYHWSTAQSNAAAGCQAGNTAAECQAGALHMNAISAQVSTGRLPRYTTPRRRSGSCRTGENLLCVLTFPSLIIRLVRAKASMMTSLLMQYSLYLAASLYRCAGARDLARYVCRAIGLHHCERPLTS